MIRIESAENLPGGYIIVPLGESQEDGVSVHTFKLKTAHNIGPDRDFRLVVNNVFEDNNPHLITVKQKGYFTPMEYMSEYNMNKTGTDFATNHANDQSGLFPQNQAIETWGWKANFAIGGTRYYLPDIRTWRSVMPGEVLHYYNGHVLTMDNVSEEIRLNTHQIKDVFTSDYRGSGNHIIYGLRLKSADNRLRTAFKYEYIDNPEGGTGEFVKALKITSRYLGPDVPGSPITVDQVKDESFWSSNNQNDVVRILPASGALDAQGTPIPGKFGESGYYWASETNSTKALGLRMLFHRFALDADRRIANPSGNHEAVRLFFKR